MKSHGIILRNWEARAIIEGRKTQMRFIVKPQPDACNHAYYKELGAEWWDKPTEFYEISSGQWACKFCGNGARLSRRDVRAIHCPFGTVGDQLWGRETWRPCMIGGVSVEYKAGGRKEANDDHELNNKIVLATHPTTVPDVKRAELRQTGEKGVPMCWRSPATMPRWASRILLEVTNVRVERVQDISDDDVTAEGIREIKHQQERRWAVHGLEHLNQVTLTAAWSYSRLWNSIHGPDAWDRNDWVWAVTFKRLEGGAA